jgi:hypothetical protein
LRLSDADRQLLARLQAELHDGRKPRVTRRAGIGNSFGPAPGGPGNNGAGHNGAGHNGTGHNETGHNGTGNNGAGNNGAGNGRPHPNGHPPDLAG